MRGTRREKEREKENESKRERQYKDNDLVELIVSWQWQVFLSEWFPNDDQLLLTSQLICRIFQQLGSSPQFPSETENRRRLDFSSLNWFNLSINISLKCKYLCRGSIFSLFIFICRTVLVLHRQEPACTLPRQNKQLGFCT